MANKKRKKVNEIPNQKKKANPKNEINEKLKQVLIEKLIEKLK